MLLLVYGLVKAPDVGWGTARTIATLGGALALLGAFVINERRARNPLVAAVDLPHQRACRTRTPPS